MSLMVKLNLNLILEQLFRIFFLNFANKVLKTSSPKMLFMVLIGAIVSYCEVMLKNKHFDEKIQDFLDINLVFFVLKDNTNVLSSHVLDVYCCSNISIARIFISIWSISIKNMEVITFKHNFT